MKNNGMLTRRPHATEKMYCGNLTSIVRVWMQLEAAMRTPPCSQLPLLERATTLVLDRAICLNQERFQRAIIQLKILKNLMLLSLFQHILEV